MTACVLSYLLEHFLSRNEFVMMFSQGTFQISDLFSLSFNLVSENTHLKPTESRTFTQANLKPGQCYSVVSSYRYTNDDCNTHATPKSKQKRNVVLHMCTFGLKTAIHTLTFLALIHFHAKMWACLSFNCFESVLLFSTNWRTANQQDR